LPVKILFIICFFLLAQAAKGQNIKLLSLDQLDKRIEKGRDTVYVINFWASWCAPCLQELPHFEKLNGALKGQRAKILLVSVDFKSKLKTAVIPVVKRLKLKNEIFLLNEQSQQTYIERVSKDWSGALPATLFINRKKNTRNFFEKEFTYKELLDTYNLNK